MALQLLGFTVRSYNCSDPKPASYNMVMENFGDTVSHFFPCMWCQSENEECKLHPGKICAEASRVSFDIGVCGTPCQPFSRQRVKRSAEGSVRNHSLFEATNSDLMDWLRCHRPKVSVVEQVMGLSIPESTSSTTTPLDRPGAWGIVELFQLKSDSKI